MHRLINDISSFARHNQEGKKQFIEFIREWSGKNLDNFVLDIQKSSFVLDGKELASVFLLLINFTLTFFIIQFADLGEWITGALLVVMTFDIQLRLIFMILPFILPSTNITLTKQGSTSNCNNEIIICAHYDIKNTMVTRQKGKIRGFIKYNIYSFSRLLTQYALKGGKFTLPVSAILYIAWFMPQNNIRASTFDSVSFELIPFTASVSVFLVLYGVLCALLMVILTLPFPKKIGNPGSDDNASGVTGALKIAQRINNLNLKSTIKVILFDNEERGLIGSSHYVAKNLKEIRKKETLVVNLDCIGRGSDIFILSDRPRSNKSYKLIEKILKENEISIRHSNIDFSDHKPFLKKGISAVSIGRYNVKRYLWVKDFPVIDWIHGCEDVPDNIDIKKIEEVVDIVSRGICREYA